MSESQSDRIELQKSKWIWSLLAAAAPIGLALAAWAHAQLWSAESRLVAIEIKQAHYERTQDELKGSIKEQLADIKLLIQRLEDKLDKKP